MHETRSKPYVEALSMVFNQPLLQGIFPENFKVSKVTPIDKGGEEMDPFNYRPISTFSSLIIRNDLEIHETRNTSDRNRRFGTSCAIIKVT